MDGERSVNTLMEGTVGEGRIKRLSWTDDVELDLWGGDIVLKSWRSWALDRRDWKARSYFKGCSAKEE